MQNPAHDPIIHDRSTGIDRLLAIMAALRHPEHGCPWDVAQTPASITSYTIEEAYEVVDTITREAWDELPGELGDLLLQVVFYARMSEEAGRFDFDTVVQSICDKMVARHPHIFTDPDAPLVASESRPDWETLKAAERGTARVLDGVAMGLPALSRAVKLQNRAARVGFDWPQTEDVLDKLLEESRELVEARDSLGAAELAEEFGDLMFVMANLARHLKIDPEEALRAANAKFTRRFNHIEDELHAAGSSPSDSNLAEMDALWDAAKVLDKAGQLGRG